MKTIKTAKKQKLKESKGITLIALVITIIVLLILAGVTIATLTGDNGILGKANEAKTKSDIVEVKEQAQLDISNWMAERIRNGEDTVLDDATVKSIIESANQNNTNKYYSELTDTSIKTKKGNEILFSDLYTKTPPSFDPGTLTIGKAINPNKYGWKVKNYNVEENETGGWRLFFQDNNYAYLISDNCVGNYNGSDYYTTITKEDGVLKYRTGADVSTIGQKLNPKISSLFTESNTNPNIRETAWLTDTSDASMWSKYKNDDAVFAIRESNGGIICSII